MVASHGKYGPEDCQSQHRRRSVIFCVISLGFFAVEIQLSAMVPVRAHIVAKGNSKWDLGLCLSGVTCATQMRLHFSILISSVHTGVVDDSIAPVFEARGRSDHTILPKNKPPTLRK